MVVFANVSTQYEVDRVCNQVNEDLKDLGELFLKCVNASNKCSYLEEHCKRDSKEKGKNASKGTPEGSSIFKTWVICFCLIDHLLIQRVVKHLKII